MTFSFLSNYTLSKSVSYTHCFTVLIMLSHRFWNIGAPNRTWTDTLYFKRGILSPLCLPIPPQEHFYFDTNYVMFSLLYYHHNPNAPIYHCHLVKVFYAEAKDFWAISSLKKRPRHYCFNLHLRVSQSCLYLWYILMRGLTPWLGLWDLNPY